MKRILILVLVISVISFQRKEITWVAIGDSITYLNEHPKEAGNRIEKGYMSLVTDKLPHIHYVNQGHNGWTAVRIATEIEKIGLVKADVYSVFLGTNDWWSGKPIGNFEDYQNNTGTQTVCGSFRIIINKLRNLNEKAKIILITPMQRADFVSVENIRNNAYGSYNEKNGQSLEQIADAIKKIGKFEHFTVVDLYSKRELSIKHLVKFKRLKSPQNGQYQDYYYPDFINIPFNPEKDKHPYPVEAIDMTYDGLHPSDKGYKFIADLLIKIMKKY